MRRHGIAFGLMVALVATGCWPTPTGTRATGRASASPAAQRSASPAPSTSPTSPGASLAPSIAPSVTPSVGVPAAPTLSGVVLGPAGIISSNGAGIISSNGAGIISSNGAGIVGNNGANWRVMASVAQVPYANARVRLLDAARNPVMDGGKPVEAITDAQGRYGFASALPTQNLIVEVALKEGKGAFQALAPRGAKTVDADFVSTLTTAYILDQYVKGQADPVATLEKLPAEVERETRTKASAAFEGGTAAVPEALTTAEVVSTVNQLRQSNTTFNEQMETVKRLLIAAGQSNLGAGRPGTEVGLTLIGGMAVNAAGELVFAAGGTGRIWRLNTDDRLETLVGVGSPTHIETSLPAAEVGFENPHQVLYDRQGRLLIWDGSYGERLTRLDGDRVHALKTIGFSHAIVPAPGDDLFAFVTPITKPPVVKLLKPDATLVDYHTLPQDDWFAVRWARRWGYDAQGRVYMASADMYENDPKTVVARFDPTAKTLEKLETIVGTGLKGLSVDGAGNIFVVDATGKLVVKKPSGTTLTLATSVPAEFNVQATGVALVNDQTAYLTNKQRDRIYRVRDGQFTHVAGSTGSSGGNTEDLALLTPTAMVVDSQGSLYVGDSGTYRIVKLDAQGKGTLFAGTGTSGTTGDGGPAAQATFSGFRAMRIDAQDNLYVLEPRGADYALRKITKSGTVSTVHTTTRFIPDFVVTQGGTIYFPDNQGSGGAAVTRLMRILPGGAPEVLDEHNLGYPAIALDAQERVLLLYYHELQRWSAAAGIETIKAVSPPFPGNPRIVADAQGRVYVGAANSVQRWDPVADTRTKVAGFGAPHFSGSGVDDSIDTLYLYLYFGPDGTLYIPDTGHKQIKRIPADQL